MNQYTNSQITSTLNYGGNMFKNTTLSLLLPLFTIYSYAQQGGILQYRLEKGKSYKYATEQEVKVSQEMMGRENVSDVVSTSTIILEPQDVAENGDITCFASFGEMVVKVHSTMMDTTLDMTNMVGKKNKLVVTKFGKTISVTPIDSFPPLRMMGGFGDPAMAFRRLLVELPDKALAVGDTWTRTGPDTVSTMGGRIIITPTTEYKVVTTENKLGYNCLKITFSGKYSLEGKGSQMGAEFFITGEGKSEGTFFFTPQEGLMIALESSSDQESTVAVTGQMNMTIPQTQTIKSKVSLVQ